MREYALFMRAWRRDKIQAVGRLRMWLATPLALWSRKFPAACRIHRQDGKVDFVVLPFCLGVPEKSVDIAHYLAGMS